MDDNFSFNIACYHIMLTTRPNWNTFNDDVLATLRCKDKTLGFYVIKKS